MEAEIEETLGSICMAETRFYDYYPDNEYGYVLPWSIQYLINFFTWSSVPLTSIMSKFIVCVHVIEHDHGNALLHEYKFNYAPNLYHNYDDDRSNELNNQLYLYCH